MTGLGVLFAKEWKSQLRTYRLLIVTALFLVFGLGTPVLLKYIGALVPAENLSQLLPEFTAMDSGLEWIDTIGQIGLVAAILLAMGAVAREREQGTATMTLSKPVSFAAFLVSKFAALSLVFAIGIAVGGLGCYFYTWILFGKLSGAGFLTANLVAWFYLVLCIAVTLMYSSFFKSQLAAGGLALVTLIVLTAAAGLPALKEHSPGALISWSKALVPATSGMQPVVLGSSLALVVSAMLVGWRVFKSREL